ncbi:MAG TPA: DUF1385 domain-containing protein [Syntrophomonadaceae bacterium]|nr:DUF1385 domain-containing protein [Syntrophomonadaceae bacterium]HNX28143.1 DUF1385 domain-containing protein [Syntrophomonadaceae bacterium]HPR93454.1 DUF1385 domain-containing protein [Syntrophomonadaceae bacterium]
MKKDVQYGGMAVIEGVMMRGKNKVAVAVRRPDGTIELEQEAIKDHAARFPFLKWPFIRGTFVLIDSMVLGIKMLNKSANMSMDEEEEELSSTEMLLTGLFAFLLAIVLFVILPTAIVHYVAAFIGGVLAQNLVEGIIRVSFFLIYVYAISRMNEIDRVFMYHGAEHKAIFTLEAGEELTIENSRKYSTSHPRCGTSFLLTVMIISILVFALLGEGTLFYRIWSRLAVLPVVAGLGYEFIKFSGNCYEKRWARILMAPGLWMQKMTTREPDDKQLEVALTALKAVLPAEAITEEDIIDARETSWAGVN